MKKAIEILAKVINALIYMSTCPNCGTIQRVDYAESTDCTICKYPIPPYKTKELQEK